MRIFVLLLLLLCAEAARALTLEEEVALFNAAIFPALKCGASCTPAELDVTFSCYNQSELICQSLLVGNTSEEHIILLLFGHQNDPTYNYTTFPWNDGMRGTFPTELALLTQLLAFEACKKKIKNIKMK